MGTRARDNGGIGTSLFHLRGLKATVGDRYLVATLTILSLVLSGCVVATTQVRLFEPLTPRPPAGEARPIMFRGLVSKLSRGQDVGTVQMGVFCEGQRKVFWQRDAQVRIDSEETVKVVRTEMTKAGYKMVGNPDSLFEDPQEWQAEYLLAGALTSLVHNICYLFQDSSGEASVEIEWQVFERRTRSVVFTATTGGTAKTERGPQRGPQAYYDAFAAALRNLLAEEKFASLISKGMTKSVQELSPMPAELLLLEAEAGRESPELIQYVHGTVVTIPIGSGHGSGFIVSPSGLVLTNAHVVGEGSGPVTVELPSGRRVSGEVLRRDKEIDVALIQLEKGQYAAAPIGSSASLAVGAPVFAIGTPLTQRLSRTVTKGVVSAFRVEDGRNLIQSDVTIHPGSSGGPLVDDHGRVVGLAQSAYLLGGRVGIGLSNFIPIEEAWKALQITPQFRKVRAAELLSMMSQSPALSTEAGATPSSPPSAKEAEVIEKLRQIQDLRQRGLITPEEAESRRKEILDRAFK